MRCLLFITCLLFSNSLLFSQVYDVEEVEGSDSSVKIANVPFAVIEKAPVYPGCTGSNNRELKKCTSDNITAFVEDKFNKKKILKSLEPNTYRTFTSFKIDQKGKIQNIRIRTPDDIIKKEVIKVLKKVPKLTPGQQRGKVVGTLYSLAIIFKIDGDHNFSFQ